MSRKALLLTFGLALLLGAAISSRVGAVTPDLRTQIEIDKVVKKETEQLSKSQPRVTARYQLFVAELNELAKKLEKGTAADRAVAKVLAKVIQKGNDKSISVQMARLTEHIKKSKLQGPTDVVDACHFAKLLTENLKEQLALLRYEEDFDQLKSRRKLAGTLLEDLAILADRHKELHAKIAEHKAKKLGAMDLQSKTEQLAAQTQKAIDFLDANPAAEPSGQTRQCLEEAVGVQNLVKKALGTPKWDDALSAGEKALLTVEEAVKLQKASLDQIGRKEIDVTLAELLKTCHDGVVMQTAVCHQTMAIAESIQKNKLQSLHKKQSQDEANKQTDIRNLVNRALNLPLLAKASAGSIMGLQHVSAQMKTIQKQLDQCELGGEAASAVIIAQSDIVTLLTRLQPGLKKARADNLAKGIGTLRPSAEHAAALDRLITTLEGIAADQETQAKAINHVYTLQIH